jgi:hypothetical protein
MGKRKYVPRTPRVQSACDSSVPDTETSEKNYVVFSTRTDTSTTRPCTL